MPTQLGSWLQSSSWGRPRRLAPVPTQIGPYVIEGLLGQGGMGVVYRGRHQTTQRAVAVKTVAALERASFESLREEIELLRGARHANIVEIVDFGTSSGDPWYAMELLEGETLAVRNAVIWQDYEPLKSPGDLRPAAGGRLSEVLSLFCELCAPLDFVHRLGIVHCDLKPSNVFLRDRHTPVLMDFGLGIRASGAIGPELLSFKRPSGTLPYMSPEALEGRVLDARADLYALGCMLYESLTGAPPFAYFSRDQIMAGHRHQDPTPASQRVRGISRALDDLLLRLLAKDPRARVGHAETVARILQSEGATRKRRGSVAPPAHLFRSSMVGRSQDLDAIASALEAARDGQGSLLFVGGESGIGKTFLVAELAQRAALRGMRVLTGQCVAAATSDVAEAPADALHPFRRCFDSIRDECRTTGDEALERLLGDGLGVLAPHFTALADLARSENVPPPLALPEAAGRERVLEAMARTLRAFLADRATVLVLDDLQWADELTLSVLERLLTDLRELPVLVLGTHRTDEGSQALTRLVGASGVQSLRLRRLDRQEVAAMTSQMLGIATPPAALTQFVFEQSEGVPFFVAEYLRTAQLEGALRWVDGTWQLTEAEANDAPLARLSLPGRLRELIRRRIKVLSPETVRVLKTAATVGREFDAAVLAMALQLSMERVHTALDEAAARYVLELPANQLPRFAHDKFRETIYAELADDARAGAHLAIAGSIERCFEGSPHFERWYGEIAHHLKLGGDSPRALGYLEKAGEWALQISADAKALAWLTDALEMERTLPERYPPERLARWERGISDAMHGLGRHRESALHLAKAAALLGHPLPASRVGFALACGRQLFRQVVHRLLPNATRRRDHGSRRQQIEWAAGDIYERLNRTSYYTGQALQLVYSCIKSLNCLEASAVGTELAKAYANAAAVCGILPARKLTVEYLEKAQRILDRSPDPVVETALRMIAGVYYLGAGQGAEAVRHIERGIDVAEMLSYGRRRDECLTVRSGVDVYAGRVSKILPRVRVLEQSSRARGDAHTLTWSQLQLLECYVIKGDLAGGVRHNQLLTPLLDRAAPPEQLWGYGLGCYLELRAGNFARAQALAIRASELADGTPPVHVQCVDAHDRLAETWLAAWRAPRSFDLERRHIERCAKRAVKSLNRVARVFPVARPMAALHRGAISWDQGRRDEALATWRAGITAAREMQLDFQEARLCAAMADALNAERRESGTMRDRSDALLDELELSRDSLPPPAVHVPT